MAKENQMSKAANRILRGLREAAEHARGEKVPGLKLHLPRRIDVSALRRRTGLSQAAFSQRIGVSAGTLRNWEQGRRTPDGPARVLLAMLARNPRIVEETLGGRSWRL
jgi:putative transcriptional regulator